MQQATVTATAGAVEDNGATAEGAPAAAASASAAAVAAPMETVKEDEHAVTQTVVAGGEVGGCCGFKERQQCRPLQCRSLECRLCQCRT